MAFTITWDNDFLTSPADSEALRLGASRIRELKTALDERLSVDHSLEGDDDDGKHKQVNILRRLTFPSPPANSGVLFVLVGGANEELHWRNSVGEDTILSVKGMVPLPFRGVDVLPLASKVPNALAYVSNAPGGAALLFAEGNRWRRLALISDMPVVITDP